MDIIKNIKFIVKIVSNFLFGILTIILSIVASSISFHILLWVFSELLSQKYNNYLIETIYYFSPIIFTGLISAYFFRRKKTKVGILIVIGGIIYYLWLWFGILWGASEGCGSVFYDLINIYGLYCN